jgi:hypothetical protein
MGWLALSFFEEVFVLSAMLVRLLKCLNVGNQKVDINDRIC